MYYVVAWSCVCCDMQVTDVFTDVYGDNTLIQLVQYDVNHQAMVQLRLARSLQADMDMVVAAFKRQQPF